MVSNPRFPHSFKVQRPLRDLNGDLVYDKNGDPTYEDLVLDVARYGSDNTPVRMSGGGFDTRPETVVPFGYRVRTKSVKESGLVDVAQLEIATPLFTTQVFDGDILVLSDYERTYKANCVRKEVTNFGVSIWLNEILS